VLNAVAREDIDRPVVQLDREADRDFALTNTEDAAHGVFETHNIGGPVELLDRRCEQISLGLFDGLRGWQLRNCNHDNFASFGNFSRAALRANPMTTTLYF
jgi:hypothetical protein